jgi:hypothetical protein
MLDAFRLKIVRRGSRLRKQIGMNTPSGPKSKFSAAMGLVVHKNISYGMAQAPGEFHRGPNKPIDKRSLCSIREMGTLSAVNL